MNYQYLLSILCIINASSSVNGDPFFRKMFGMTPTQQPQQMDGSSGMQAREAPLDTGYNSDQAPMAPAYKKKGLKTWEKVALAAGLGGLGLLGAYEAPRIYRAIKHKFHGKNPKSAGLGGSRRSGSPYFVYPDSSGFGTAMAVQNMGTQGLQRDQMLAMEGDSTRGDEYLKNAQNSQPLPELKSPNNDY